VPSAGQERDEARVLVIGVRPDGEDTRRHAQPIEGGP
jgi:hypothetical protein